MIFKTKVLILTLLLTLGISSTTSAHILLSAGSRVVDLGEPSYNNRAGHVRQFSDAEFRPRITYHGMTGSYNMPLGSLPSLNINLPYSAFQRPSIISSTRSLDGWYILRQHESMTGELAWGAYGEWRTLSNMDLRVNIRARALNAPRGGRYGVYAFNHLNIISGSHSRRIDIHVVH